MTETPLLGVAGAFGQAELALARRFDELHQLIYARGGIRPTNAAIEEVAKLIFLRLWSTRAAGDNAANSKDLFRGLVSDQDLVAHTKAAFLAANGSDVLGIRSLGGKSQSLWPADEPFRLTNPEVLRAAIALVDEIVSDEDRAVSDPLGTAFDAFLSGKYDHSGGLGTFLTPSAVARAMADIAFEIANPLDGWDGSSPLVADPFCGTGRFLVAAFEAAEAAGASPTQLRALLDHGIVGADQSPTATAKSAMNLMLYGATTPHVFPVSDSVTSGELGQLRGSLQLIITNPPFGGGKYTDAEGIDYAAKSIPSLGGKDSIDPALACTVRALDLLADGGVLGIVLPDGIVDGRQFDELVRLSDEFSVVANISLPTATFALSGTVAKTSAVFIRKSARPERTILARVDHVGFIRQAGKAAVDPAGNQLPDVVAGVTKALQFGPTIDLLHQISVEPVVASIASAAVTSLDPNRIDPAALAGRARLEAKNGQQLGELIGVGTKLRQGRSHSGLPFVSVLHVDAFGTIDWTEADQYSPTTPGKIARAGDVVVSLLNPSKLRAAVIPSDRAEVLCSSEFGVFTPSVDPYAVLGLLYNPDVQVQLRPLGRGTSSSRRRISPADVLDLVVPRLTGSQLDELAVRVRRSVVALETARSELAVTYSGTSGD